MSSTQQTVTDPASLVRDQAAMGTWFLDRSASRVGFRAKTFWGLVTVRGRFTDVDGQVEVHSNGTLSARLIIDAASVDTKQKKRDEHLRSGEFFDAAQHPRMEIAVDEVTFTGLDR